MEVDEKSVSEEQVSLKALPIVLIKDSYDSFSDFDLDPRIVEAAKKIGWEKPTPVQQLCLPHSFAGLDVAGFAQTGTGKTAVFVLSIAKRLLATAPTTSSNSSPRAVVLAPTRELAMQIEEDAKKVFDSLSLSSLAVYGGVDIDRQIQSLKLKPSVIVATPGRLKDLIQRNLINLKQIEVFVCDEADRMLDMGFVEDVEFFLDRIPENAQKLLFSATTSDHIKELAFEYLNRPVYVSVNPETITPENIEQHAVICDSSNKLKVILGLFRELEPECAIVFTNTKLVAEWLQFKLNGNGIEADLITGDLPQSKRIALIKRIKEGRLKALIATDVASRGLHISKITHVFNFDVPEDPSNYVHRIGRTARAGAFGKSYTLVCDDYGANMQSVVNLLGSDLAPKATWFNQSYLTIKDQAGNPFELGGPLFKSPLDDKKRFGAQSKPFGERQKNFSPKSGDVSSQSRKPGQKPEQGSSKNGRDSGRNQNKRDSRAFELNPRAAISVKNSVAVPHTAKVETFWGKVSNWFKCLF